jgi:assimilatory nitrate reductase catalytic subunit
VHPDTARRAGLTDGAWARVAARRGRGQGALRGYAAAGHGVPAVPLRRNQEANLLTNPALDPISRMPEFKVCAVRLESMT